MSEELSEDNINLEVIYSILRKNTKKTQKNNEILVDQYFFNQNNFELYKEEIKNSLKYISFNEKSNWSYSTFSTSINNHNIEFPEILSNTWTSTIPNVDNGMDITNKIFICEERINYKIVNNLIKANILLKGDSMFWIFLHSNGVFDDKTIVILFSKKEFTQRVSMSLGCFVNLDLIDNTTKKENNFYLFQKQQLIKSYEIQQKYKENDKYERNDTCLIKITIIDEGFDKIKIKSKLNDGEEENELIGRIFKQVASLDNIEQSNTNTDDEDKNYRVMIAGNGSSCKVINFFCETSLKKYIGNNNFGMRDGCDCCEIV